MKAMKYRLWDTDIGRLIGSFDTEEEALTLVRALAANAADGLADDLTLSHEREDGSRGESRSGASLLARAEMVVARNARGEAPQGAATDPRGSSGSGASGYDTPTEAVAAKGYSLTPNRPRRGMGAPGRGARRKATA